MSNIPDASSAPVSSESNQPLSGALCYVASLGCPKNLVDSETAIGRLVALGAERTENAEEVDFCVINTCGFLRSACAEAEDYIRQAIALKHDRAVRFLLVLGCAVVSDGKELAEKYPQVDAWLSPYDEAKIGDVAVELYCGTKSSAEKSAEPEKPGLNVLSPIQVAAAKFYQTSARNLTLDDSTRVRLTAPHVAYLKIADGCDRFCTYCAIPNIRGRYVSKPFETILDEASRLADTGVRELVLIAQETTFWGNDLYGKPDLKRLLAALKEKNQFDWIRVLYTYPLFWDSELTSLFKMEDRGKTSILPYIDVPLQHCNSELLKKMNRRVDKVQTEELLAQFREEIPNVVLRTSLIVGFPGETDAMYQELVDFVEKQRFERAGVFEYSAEPGTIAFGMENQIPPEIKRRRYERLYAKQERISRQFARGKIGQVVDVMLDSHVMSESGDPMNNCCVGRTIADAPDVDPVVYVTGRNLELGVVTPCEVVEADGMNLIAVPVDEDKLFVTKDERRSEAEREEARAYREQGLTPPQKKRPKRNDRNGGNNRNGRNNSNRKNFKRRDDRGRN